jgi:hypothetical protein
MLETNRKDPRLNSIGAPSNLSQSSSIKRMRKTPIQPDNISVDAENF